MRIKKVKKIHFRKKRIRKIISFNSLMLTEIVYCVENIIIKTRLMRDSYNQEYLHEIRVSLRKLISLINFFRELIEKNELKKVKKTLHDLIEPTSQARDYDIAMTNYIYPSFKDNISNNEIDKFKNHCMNKINNLHDEALTVLSSREYREMLNGLKAWANEYNWDKSAPPLANMSLAEYLVHRLEQRYYRATRHTNKLFNLPYKKLHHHRIKLKELRYVIEIFKFYIKDYENALTRLKRIQDILGDINDTYATEKILKDMNLAGAAATQHYKIKKVILKNRKSYLKVLKNKI
jgi:CHAD domain-containing protein